MTPVQLPDLVPPTIRIIDPIDGATVTAPTPVRADITPPAGQEITEWCVYAQRAGDTQSRTVKCGTGAPAGRDLATFDPTVLPNGTWTITVDATADGGGAGFAQVGVVVSGALKPGRYSVSYTDMDLPIQTLPIRVTRSYDSFDKSKGDFGIGWRVGLDGFRVSVNRPLGEGGWASRESDCLMFFNKLRCLSTDYEDLRSHVVTVTWPDGHTEAFDFTPTANAGRGARWHGRVHYENDQETVFDPKRFELTAKDNTRYVLDVATGLVSSIDPHGNTLEVDEDGIRSSLGTNVTFTRDGQGRITRISGPSGEKRTYAYSPAGDLVTVTDSLDHSVKYEYDGDHNLTKTIDPSGRPMRTVEYDSDGRIARIIDAGGNAVDLDVSADGRQQTVTSPDGRLTTVTTSDIRGNETQVDEVADGQTRTSRFQYDTNDYRTAIIDPLGHSTTFEYDARGNETARTDPLGNATRHEYDSSGYLAATTTPDGSRTSVARSAQGVITEIADPLGNRERYGYDSRGNQTSRADALNRIARTAYDGAGNPTSVTDPSGAASVLTYDDSGNLTSVSASGLGTTVLQYDTEGQLRALVDAAGNAVRYTYDSLGRRTGVTDQLGRTTTTTYDVMGRKIQVSDREGAVTSMSYNERGLVVEKRADGAATSYSYDGFGRLRVAENAEASIRIAYDAADRPTSFGTTFSSSGRTETVSYSYDDADRRVSTSYAGVTDTYSYEPNGRVTELASGAGIFRFAYDRAGRRTSTQRPNGVTTTYAYNAADQVESIVHTKSGQTLDDARYTYDGAGRRTSVRRLGESHGYSYDVAGRLTTVETPNSQDGELFSYDVLGNRIGGGQRYDAANRIEARDGYSYVSDKEGRVSQRIAANGEATRFNWDAQSRLRSVALPDGRTTSYDYDPLGRRVATTRRGETSFDLYGLDANPVARIEDSRTTRYTFGLEQDTPLSMTVSGRSTYFQQDALGTVTSLTDATGAVVGRYSYSAYGDIETQSGIESPFTFTGRPHEPDSGLYDFRARWYEPGAGRFVSEDPVETTDRYGYASANPIARKDPSGLWTMGEGAQADAISSDLHVQGSSPSVSVARSAQQLKNEAEAFAKLKPNNYRHIFKAKHKFDDIVEEIGGEEAVMRALIKGVTQLGITAGRYEACLVVLGRTVVVRGNVVDGVVRIGTAFVL